MRGRVFYLVFLVSLFLLSGLFRSPRQELRAPGGSEYSDLRRVAHYSVLSVIAAVSGYFSVVQLKRDWTTFNNRDKS